jgi:hypothetical protein
MAGINDKQLARRSSWPAGIANVPPETSLPRDENGNLVALREADNVDLLADGKLARRGGRAKVYTGAPHSLWRDGHLPFALFVDGTALRAFYGPGQVVDLAAVATRECSYALVDDKVYWSNGLDTGIVTVDGDVLPWGCPQPPGQPTLTAVAGTGGLHAGRYQVAITYLTGSGEESGTGAAVLVDVAEGGGIALSGIPTPPASVSVIRVYVTQADGDVLYQAVDLTPGVGSAMLNFGVRRKPLATQFLEPMPAGRIVRWLNGRVYVATADGSMVWSEALRYGLTNLRRNSIGYGRIAMMEPIGAGGDGAGLFVADQKRTYWLGGNDPANFTRRIVYHASAIPGTAVRVPASLLGLDQTGEALYWLAEDGVGMVGLPGGTVQPQRGRQVVAPKATGGASLWREQEGRRQVLTALKGAGAGRRGVTFGDRVVATVEHHE